MEHAATKRVTLTVSGMSCGGCAAGVERTLRQALGVTEARVDFGLGQARIAYDPERTDPQALTELVTASGYEVSALS